MDSTMVETTLLSTASGRPRRLPSIDIWRQAGLSPSPSSAGAAQFRSSRLVAVASADSTAANASPASVQPTAASVPSPPSTDGSELRRLKRKQVNGSESQPAADATPHQPASVTEEPPVAIPDTRSETARLRAVQELKVRETNLNRLQFYRRATARLRATGMSQPVVLRPSVIRANMELERARREQAEAESAAMQQSLNALLSSSDFSMTPAECTAVYDRLSEREVDLVMRSLQKIVLDRYGAHAEDVDATSDPGSDDDSVLTLGDIQQLLVDRLRDVKAERPRGLPVGSAW